MASTLDAPSPAPAPTPAAGSTSPTALGRTPSMSSTTSSTSTSSLKTYSLSSLLALAPAPFSRLQTPQSARLGSGSFSSILRNGSVAEWGVDESVSSLLDEDGRAKSVKIEVNADDNEENKLGAAAGTGGQIVFDYPFSFTSLTPPLSSSRQVGLPFVQSKASDKRGDEPASLLVDFSSTNPFAASAKQALPVGFDPTLPLVLPKGAPLRLGTRSPSISLHSPPPHSSGESSPTTSLLSKTNFEDLGLRRASASNTITKSHLNAFAPPFPLPNTTPLLHPSQLAPGAGTGLGQGTGMGSSVPSPSPSRIRPFPGIPAPARKESSILPISTSSPTGVDGGKMDDPHTNFTSTTPTIILPASLPAKPSCLPPVFIKKESAALPQPMSLPDIAPLGEEWEGEVGMSGNEKRRLSGMSWGSSSASAHGSDAEYIPRSIGIKHTAAVAVAAGDRASSWRANVSQATGINATAARRQSVPSETTQRPERLVKLGQSLRASVSAPRKALV